MNCIICFETSPSSVSCYSCNKSFCRACCEQHLLYAKGNPCCADKSCEAAWPRDFLYAHMSRDFMKMWIKKRQEDLFKKEMPLMAATTALAYNHKEAAAKRSQAMKLRDDARALMKQVAALREEASRLEFQASSLESVRLADVTPDRYQRRCFTNGCRGFLNNNFECAVCSAHFCYDCHTSIAGEHKCDKGQVANILFIEATSRGCPTCSTLISKTEGCDQMYCIVCDTAFSWNSGQVDTGFIHNPHYLRRMEAVGHIPRAPIGDALPAWRDLADLIPRNEELVRGFYALLYNLVEKQHDLFVPVNNDYERAQLIIGKMTEDKFRSVIQLKEKHWLLRREIAKTTDAFLRVGCRLFWEFSAGERALGDLRENAEKMRVTANEELLQVSRRWERLCVPHYNTEFEVSKQKWRSD